jgi:hypothetical protein
MTVVEFKRMKKLALRGSHIVLRKVFAPLDNGLQGRKPPVKQLRRALGTQKQLPPKIICIVRA